MNYSQPTLDVIGKLRRREPVKLFDRSNKVFHHIQINSKAKSICWMRYISKDRQNWILQNEYLSLREVLDLRAEIAIRSQAAMFAQTVKASDSFIVEPI